LVCSHKLYHKLWSFLPSSFCVGGVCTVQSAGHIGLHTMSVSGTTHSSCVIIARLASAPSPSPSPSPGSPVQSVSSSQTSNPH
jgi:hypothetical protein